MTIRIAISASYFNIPCVQTVLRTCDVIFTSNVDQLPRLIELFGDKVKTIEYDDDGQIIGLPLHDEKITFSDLRKAIKARLADGDQETAKLLTDYCGWSKFPIMLYDEEGLEGYQWRRRDGTGHEYEIIGGEVPDEVIEAMAKGF